MPNQLTDGAGNWVDPPGTVNGAFTQGPVAAGAAVAGNPHLMGGTDGTNARALLTDTAGRLIVAPGGGNVATHAPAVNTQATCAAAAGGGTVKNVCTAISLILSNDTTGSAAQATFNLRDGATGAGTILATWTLSVPATAGACQTLVLEGLDIPGTANTAMTLESTAGPALHTAAAVTLVTETRPS